MPNKIKNILLDLEQIVVTPTGLNVETTLKAKKTKKAPKEKKPLVEAPEEEEEASPVVESYLLKKARKAYDWYTLTLGDDPDFDKLSDHVKVAWVNSSYGRFMINKL